MVVCAHTVIVCVVEGEPLVYVVDVEKLFFSSDLKWINPQSLIVGVLGCAVMLRF